MKSKLVDHILKRENAYASHALLSYLKIIIEADSTLSKRREIIEANKGKRHKFIKPE